MLSKRLKVDRVSAGYFDIGQGAPYKVWGAKILYTDWKGNPYTYLDEKDIIRPLMRLRIAKGLELKKQAPKKVKITKYLQPKGVPTKPYFTALYHYFNNHSASGAVDGYSPYDLHKQRYVVIVEGEFKAEALCKIGIPAIGLAGIHNFGTPRRACYLSKRNQFKEANPTKSYYCQNGKLTIGQRKVLEEENPSRVKYQVLKALKKDAENGSRQKGKFVEKAHTGGFDFDPEIERFLKENPQIKGLIYMHDADALEGDEERRLGSFYTSVRNFYLAMSEHKHLEAYYCHPSTFWSNIGKKGIDDILPSIDEDILKSLLGIAPSYQKPPQKPTYKGDSSLRKEIADSKKRVGELAIKLSKYCQANASAAKVWEIQREIAKEHHQQINYAKQIQKQKAKYLKKVAKWKEQTREGKADFLVRPFKSDGRLLEFTDLRAVSTSALRQYFASRQKAVAVRCNRSQVPSSSESASKNAVYDPLAHKAINIDWFEVAIKSEVFLRFDPHLEHKKDVSTCPDEIVLDNGWVLKWKGTNAGHWKYFYSVQYHGIQFGVLRGGDMGEVCDPDLVMFQANNEQLYLSGFFSRFNRFLSEVGGVVNNLKRVDIALDVPASGFLPMQANPEYDTPLDFFRELEVGKYEKLGRAGCHFGKFGTFENYVDSRGGESSKIVVNGVQVGSMQSARMVSVYNKTKKLQKEHKPYINEYHEANGLVNCEVWRFEYRLMRDELKNYPNLKIGDLANTRTLIDLIQKSSKGFFEFVPANHPNKKKRMRERIKLFDFEGVKPVKLNVRKTKESVKDGQRSTLIQMKKYVRSYMLTGEKAYLQLFCKDHMRFGVGGDKLKYWFEDIQREKDSLGKWDDLYPVSYGQLMRDISQAHKIWDKSLQTGLGSAQSSINEIETVAYGTDDDEEVPPIRDWDAKGTAEWSSDYVSAPF